MPIPRPEHDETMTEYIERCMGDSVMKKEYPNNKQRIAVCAVQWRKDRT